MIASLLAAALALPAVSASAAPTPAPTPTPTPTPTASPAPSTDQALRADGSVDPAAYRAMASRLATPAGIAYRFGAASSTYGAASSDRPTAKKATTKRLDTHGKRPTTTYQVGGPQDPAKDDYSSNQGQVGYVSTEAKPTVGVDHVETLSMGENTFSMKPRLSWTYYGGGHPEPDLVGDAAPASCLRKLGTKPGRFVAQARAYAHGEATVNTLMVFDNGVVAAAGTNTARGRVCLKLPSKLHPSAISVTNGNEFALITAWNTTTLRSELAVVVLGGAQRPGAFWDYEWTRLYPGMQNAGMPTFAKLLGTVPLPVATATGVSAVSDTSFGEWLKRPDGSNVNRAGLPLTDETVRQSFIGGANSAQRARAGYAVVFSRSEKKVVFVDLQPLFSAVTGSYFRGRAEFDAALRSIGKGADQFPKKFRVAPASKPKVVKTITLTQTPTAVAAMLSGKRTPTAYVATDNGRLTAYAVGGLASSARASADAIVAKGSITVGRNPTGITYVKDRPGSALKQQLDDTLIVTSRADREVQWVRLKGDSGKVVRTLRDSRLVDPIAAEDNNTHGTESYVISIADYGARRLFDYRYGPVILHTNGGARFGLPAGHRFEFGGSYNPRGRPFSISVTNVT